MSRKKLNVLFIITDQQRADHLGCSGNPDLKTPNIDRLASEGIRFSNAFCANPICSPNRASILTGQYPNVHGVRSNGIILSEDVQTITQTLSDQGWHTAAIGKLHHQFFHNPHKGFEFIQSWENQVDWVSPEKGQIMRDRFRKPYYGYNEVELAIGHGDLVVGHYIDWLEEKSPKHANYIKGKYDGSNDHATFVDLMHETELPEELYPTSYITERTIAFLERYSAGEYGEKPFFLFCSYPDPHHPLCPPGKYKDMYKPEEIQLPSSFNDLENHVDHPLLGVFIKNHPFPQFDLIERKADEEETRRYIALTYGSLSLIDHGVGQILASLEKLGLAEDTIIIYTSDHGDLMGDHGLILKGPSPFNGPLQVPMIWKGPGIVKGTISDSLISSIDFAPTLMKLLGIRKNKQPPNMQGVDISSILKDPTKKIRDHCFIEEDEELMTVKFRLRHLITEEYKMTIYNRFPGYGEIFDRKNDPDELNNLWEKNPDLRYELIEKLFYINLDVQNRHPPRQAQG